MTKLYLIMAVFLLFNIGCADKNGASPSSGAPASAQRIKGESPHPVLSDWIMQYGTAHLDLSGAGNGTSQVAFPFINGNEGSSTGALCQCVMSMNGTNDSGSFTLASCTYQPGTGSGNPSSDPLTPGGCPSRNGNYIYARVDIPDMMTICDKALTACNNFQ